MIWLMFTLIAATAWGCYGVLAHTGQVFMRDPVHGRYKVLFFVGIGYSLVTVIGSGIMLAVHGAQWSFPAKGMLLSALAGFTIITAGFNHLLAFAARGSPAVVISIVAASAPTVNAVVSITLYPPPPGSLQFKFIFGIVLAAVGGFMVGRYRPGT